MSSMFTNDSIRMVILARDYFQSSQKFNTVFCNFIIYSAENVFNKRRDNSQPKSIVFEIITQKSTKVQSRQLPFKLITKFTELH